MMKLLSIAGGLMHNLANDGIDETAASFLATITDNEKINTEDNTPRWIRLTHEVLARFESPRYNYLKLA
jgi:hypothetical protein